MNRRSFLSSLAAITPIGLLLANQKPKRYRLTDEQKRKFALSSDERRYLRGESYEDRLRRLQSPPYTLYFNPRTGEVTRG